MGEQRVSTTFGYFDGLDKLHVGIGRPRRILVDKGTASMFGDVAEAFLDVSSINRPH